MPIFDVTCVGCQTKLGEVQHSELPAHAVDAHLCKDCFLGQYDGSEWIHVSQQPSDVGHMSPVPTMVVVARNLVEEVNADKDNEITATLMHHDLRDDPLPMVMGQLIRRLIGGITQFDQIYIRGTGCFRFRFDAPGHEPTYTVEFKVM